MNDFDEKIKKAMKKEIEKPLSYEYAIKNAFLKTNKKKSINSFYKIIVTTLYIIISCTSVMAASYFVYEMIWKKPIEYNSYEEKVESEKKNEEIQEGETENIVSTDYILEKANNILQQLDYSNEKLSINLKRSYSEISDLYYEVKTSADYSSGIELNFNAEDGELIYFIDRDIDSNYNANTTNVSDEYANNIGKEIFSKLNLNKNYKLKEINEIVNSMNNTQRNEWYLKYCIEYDGILNEYQRVEIRFYIENNNAKVSQIAIYDDGYNYENNELKLARDDAEKIAKEKDRLISELDIKTIDINLDIKPMNEFIYLQEKSFGKDDGITNENLDDGTNIIYSKYSNEKILRKVWNVKIKYQFNYIPDEPVHNWKEQFGREYYIDATTGEIIGGNRGDNLVN